MNTVRRSLGILALTFVLLVMAGLFYVFLPVTAVLSGFDSLFLLLLAVILTRYWSQIIIDRRVRRYLLFCGGMIIFFFLLRALKFNSFRRIDLISRRIWYLYYVPMLVIPQISLSAALALGLSEDKKLPRWRFVVIPVNLLLILLILTNDYHQLVFRFQDHFACWQSEYERKLPYYVTFFWILCLFIITLLILVRKCRVLSGRALVWLPVAVMICGLIYIIIDAMDKGIFINGRRFLNFQELFCFTYAATWNSLISVGIIPSNEGYSELFELSRAAVQIADAQDEVVYQSHFARRLTSQQMHAQMPLALDENTILDRKKVSGGNVFWQKDISEQNRINEELLEVHQRIEEEAEVIRLDNELRERKAQIEANSRLYDTIAVQVQPMSRKIAQLAREAQENAAKSEKNMALICLLGTYIKRYANLMLLAKSQKAFSSAELRLAVQETLRSLKQMNIPTSCVETDVWILNAETAANAYHVFHEIIEENLEYVKAVYVAFRNGRMRLNIEGVEIQNHWAAQGVILNTEEGISYIDIPAGEEATLCS